MCITWKVDVTGDDRWWETLQTGTGVVLVSNICSIRWKLRSYLCISLELHNSPLGLIRSPENLSSLHVSHSWSVKDLSFEPFVMLTRARMRPRCPQLPLHRMASVCMCPHAVFFDPHRDAVQKAG